MELLRQRRSLTLERSERKKAATTLAPPTFKKMSLFPVRNGKKPERGEK